MKKGYVFILLIVALLGSQCSFTKKIRTGEEAFEVKQYSIAAQMLTEEYKQTTYLNEKGKKAFLIGSSYERMNQIEPSIEWYRLADEHNFGVAATEKYAEMLKRAQKYQEAIQVYRELARENNNAIKYRQKETACQLALEWQTQQDQNPYQINSLPFNSPSSDYAPYVMGPELIAFTSDRPQSTGDDLYTWTGNHYSDLFVVNIGSDLVESLDPNINTKDNEGTIILNRDQTEMYFTRCYAQNAYDGYCKIMFSIRRGTGWSEPEPLPFQLDEINYGHPVISDSDSLMFFSANDPAGSGGYDIYYSERGENGWQEPILLSKRVNTEGNEKFPTLHKDTLYFASDHHVGMGGLDIFKTYPLDDGQWAPPQNLKPPVNSGWDDFGFVVDTFARLRGDEAQKGFFSSSRITGSGSDDIYAFTKLNRSPKIDDPEVVADDQKPEPKKYRLYLALKVVTPILEDAEDPNSKRIGKKPLKGTAITASFGPRASLFHTDNDGYAIFEIEYNTEYRYDANHPGHFTNFLELNTNEFDKDPNEPTKTINRELMLEPIIRNKEIVLDNIYYDLDKWNIRDDAKPTLDSLANILKLNPKLNIELGAHTDCRDTDEYNMTLSQRRAQSAMLYLMRKGISSSRLSSVGYGESKPAVNCICESCSEEQHQANRRTTFKIVN